MSIVGILILFLLVAWAAGYFGVGYAGYKGNNMLHVILVVVVVLIILEYTGILHTGFGSRHR